METGGQQPGWIRSLPLVRHLTTREYQVFLQLAEGLGNSQIANSLFITERTVRAHLTQVMVKLELDSRLQACLASYVHRFGPGIHIGADDNIGGSRYESALVHQLVTEGG